MQTMRSRATADLVAVRALVIAAFSLLLASIAHTTAGGLLPAAWALGLMGVLTFAGAAMTLDTQASRTRLVLLLIGSQTTIHVAMTALAGHGDEGGLRATTVPGALADAVHHVSEDLVADGPMMLAHLAAAAATGLLLGHAERALWAVLGLLARAASFVVLVLRIAPVTGVRGPATPRPSVTAGLPRLQSRLLTRSAVVRRGPPALLPAH